jgi:hypothetical protein
MLSRSEDGIRTGHKVERSVWYRVEDMEVHNHSSTKLRGVWLNLFRHLSN